MVIEMSKSLYVRIGRYKNELIAINAIFLIVSVRSDPGSHVSCTALYYNCKLEIRATYLLIKVLEVFHMRCTRKICLITISRVKESIRDEECLEESKLALTQLSSQLANFTFSLEKR